MSEHKDCQTPAPTALVFTCEHGGNRVPAGYRSLFRDCDALLESHRGYDPGALVMARALSRHFGAPLLTSTVSRLVVDLNRSIGHRNLHIEAIQALPAESRRLIIERHYHPYRSELERLVNQGIARQGKIIHISCHSFTDCLDGVVRNTDVGLLYDPSRDGEAALCATWKSALRTSSPDLVVRRNFPYEGRNDGLTTSLRKKFASNTYLGIELELNQKHLLPPASQWARLRAQIIASLDTTLGEHRP